MLRFNGVELRELPGCYNAMSPLSVSLLVNLLFSMALLMIAVCMTHALNYLCFCIHFIYGFIWITYVPTLILSLLDNMDCQIGEYENLAWDSFYVVIYFFYRIILVTLLVLFFVGKIKHGPASTCCQLLHVSLLDLNKVAVGFRYKCSYLISLYAFYIMLFYVLAVLMSADHYIGNFPGPIGHFTMLTNLNRCC